jgi:hypothetical protein
MWLKDIINLAMSGRVISHVNIELVWRLALWSSGQSSWLQIQRSGFYSRHYQILRNVVDLEQGPLRLVNAIEELFGRKSSSSGLEIREYSHRDPLRCPRGTLYPQKLTLTSPISGGSSVSIVRSQIQAMEFFFYSYQHCQIFNNFIIKFYRHPCNSKYNRPSSSRIEGFCLFFAGIILPILSYMLQTRTFLSFVSECQTVRMCLYSTVRI